MRNMIILSFFICMPYPNVQGAMLYGLGSTDIWPLCWRGLYVPQRTYSARTNSQYMLLESVGSYYINISIIVMDIYELCLLANTRCITDKHEVCTGLVSLIQGEGVKHGENMLRSYLITDTEKVEKLPLLAFLPLIIAKSIIAFIF